MGYKTPSLTHSEIAEMPDPFVSNSNTSRITLETKVGLVVIFVVLVTVSICAWLKYSSQHSSIPLHIRNAPVARHVGPDHYLAPIENSLVENTNVKTELVKIAKSAQSIADATNPIGTTRAEVKRDFRPKSLPAQYVPEQRRIAKPSARLVDTQAASARKPDKERSAPQIVLDRTPKIASLNPARDISDDYVAPEKVSLPAESPVNEFAQVAKKFTGMFSRDHKDHKTNSDQSRIEASGESLPAADMVSNGEQGIGTVGFNQEVRSNDFVASPLPNRMANSNVSKMPFSMISQNPKSNELTAANSIGVDDKKAKISEFPDDENVALEVIDRKAGVESTIREIESPTALVTEAVEFSTNQVGQSEGRTHIVETGDSFWTIAQTYYDDGRLFKALFEYNRTSVRDFDDLQPGATISIPAVAELKRRFSHAVAQTDLMARSDNEIPSEGIYRTKEGDTLFNIAREVTGQASKYLELIRLNHHELPSDVTHLTRLRGGLSLQLPKR